MKRRQLLKIIPAGILASIGALGFSRLFASQKTNETAANANAQQQESSPIMNSIEDLSTLESNPVEITPFNLSKEDWQSVLTPEQFHVLRKEGTERPGSSPLNTEKRAGQFVCAGCGLALFDTTTKYESGTGWPSFYQGIEGRLGTKTDWKIGVPRTEYHCIRCGGHHGHVFKDGPQPTGLRYCNNGIALDFIPAENIES